MADCLPTSCDQSCISFRHSGGLSNDDPCMDLGGEISINAITTGLDNLFHSIGPKLSRRGHVDYRCFYIKNIDSDAVLRNVSIYFTNIKKGGTYVEMGILLQNEKQRIQVQGVTAPNNGEYFQVAIPGYDAFNVYYDPNITKWTGNFQTAIRAVDGLQEVVVVGYGIIPTTAAQTLDVTFDLNFGGHDTRDGYIHMQAARHDIGLAVISANTLLSGAATVTPSPLLDGSPVNTTAELIPDEITAPSGIPFNTYLKGNPARVGSLLPGEYFPVWIRRTLPIVDPYYGALARNGQMAKSLERFSIAVDATSP